MKKSKTRSQLFLPAIQITQSTKPNQSSMSVKNISDKVRIRNYITLYKSSNPEKPKQLDQIDSDPLKIQKKRITKSIQLNVSESKDSITESSINKSFLERKYADLVYEIQKATSDKLELIRDIATYEYNFNSQFHLKNIFERLAEFGRLMPKSCKVKDLDVMIKRIENQYQSLLVSENLDFQQEFCESEDFLIKKRVHFKIKEAFLHKSIVISDVHGIITIHGTK